jgi:ADP-ribose pyrophosphatase
MSSDIGSPEDCITRYRALRLARPDCFLEPANSPIAILTDDQEIAAAQAEEAERRQLRNQRAPDLRIGVLAADPYLGILTRDAVRFPDRSRGIYNRHIGELGCMVMPKIGDHIILIRIFRHANRDWTWEFPGGYISPGEQPEVAAMHELEEEIGAIRPLLHALGTIRPYPSFSSTCTHLYMATIDDFGEPQSAEGIASVEKVSPARLFEMVDNGEISDASTLACILKAKLRGLIA